ncbi:hypothetical protein I2709_001353 [Vibrio mimicus]
MNHIIRVLRLLIAVGLIIVSVFFLNENVSTLFERNATYIVVRGFMTLWAMFGLFFLGLSVLIMSILTKESWRESRFNKIYVTSILINVICLSPALSGILWSQLKGKSEAFVSCDSLTRESRRYSSHTYAITSEECARLEVMNR